MWQATHARPQDNACKARHVPDCSCKHKAPTRTQNTHMHTQSVMHTCSSHTPKLVLVQRVQAAARTCWRCMPDVVPRTHPQE